MLVFCERFLQLGYSQVPESGLKDTRYRKNRVGQYRNVELKSASFQPTLLQYYNMEPVRHFLSVYLNIDGSHLFWIPGTTPVHKELFQSLLLSAIVVVEAEVHYADGRNPRICLLYTSDAADE